MADSGELDLDAPICRYVSDLKDLPVARSITARHLLSHTGGYQGVTVADPSVRYYFSWPKLVALLHEGDTLFPPGSVFNYEHTECVLLGELLQQITGSHIHDLYREIIFKPLDICCGNTKPGSESPELTVQDHAFDASVGDYVALRNPPHCGFWDASLSDLTMSLPDMVTLGEAVAGFRKTPVFSARTVEMIRAPCIWLPRTFGGPLHEQVPLAFGCGCAQYSASVFGHNGSARGQTVALRFDLRSRLVVAVGLSCWQPYLRDLLCSKLIASMSGPAAEEPIEPHAAERGTANIPGRYIGTRGSFVDVSPAGEDFVCTVGAAAAKSRIRILLHPLDSGELEVRTDASHLTVGFFTAPGGDGQSAMMIALNAYRRESPPVYC